LLQSSMSIAMSRLTEGRKWGFGECFWNGIA